MDVTNVFKACLKTVKTRNKALGVLNEKTQIGQKNSILTRSTRRCPFSSKAKDIISNISKLRDFIMEHRKAYINVEHLSDSSGMRDIERDQIDADAQVVMKTCSSILREFKQEVLQQACTPQQREHRQAVLRLIEDYLRDICQAHSEQRAIRIKRTIDKQKMLRLEPDSKKIKTAEDGSISDDKTDSEIDRKREPQVLTDRSSFDQDDSDDAPTSEEIQMFEQENQRLYDELSTVADEVRHIEGQVMEISKLQDIFTSKVLQQDHDLDRVTDTVLHTTENIKTANEDIREAMKKNASFRAYLLFFLIVLAFSLLFLDWYNP